MPCNSRFDIQQLQTYTIYGYEVPGMILQQAYLHT